MICTVYSHFFTCFHLDFKFAHYSFITKNTGERSMGTRPTYTKGCTSSGQRKTIDTQQQRNVSSSEKCVLYLFQVAARVTPGFEP